MLDEPDLMCAKTLLAKYLDLLGYTPDVADWTEEKLGDNPPRYHRLLRLQALFAAYGLPWDVPAFRQGEFITDVGRYQPVWERMLAEYDDDRMREHNDEHAFRYFFRSLLGYRERVDRVLGYHSGVMMASGLYAYACVKVHEVNEPLRHQVEPIEDLLAEFISPTWQTFPRAELVRDFGYSDVDLWAIDADWA